MWKLLENDEICMKNREPEWDVLMKYGEWGNARFECEVRILSKFPLILESFSIEYEHCKSKDERDIEECVNYIDGEKRRCEYDWGSDNRLDIERLEIREYDHKELAEVEKHLISRSNRHIGHGRNRMTNEVNSHNKENREKWGNESREKENDSKKKE